MPYVKQIAPYHSKGSAVQFTVGYYDRGLISALELLNIQMNKKKMLALHINAYLIQIAIPVARETLAKKDATTWDKILPPTRVFKQSKSIYRRVSASLHSEVDEATGVVTTGSFPLPYGVTGSRQTKDDKRTIAQIVMRGMRPFVYRKASRTGNFRRLPHTVRSSIRFGSLKRSEGKSPYGVQSSIPMQLKGKHPGFTGRQRMDFVGHMEKMIKTDYKERFLPRAITNMARESGFVENISDLRGSAGYKKFSALQKGAGSVSYAYTSADLQKKVADWITRDKPGATVGPSGFSRRID